MNIWAFPWLEWLTKVKAGQTGKYNLVGSVSLAFMLRNFHAFLSTFLLRFAGFVAVFVFSAYPFLLRYPFIHQQEAHNAQSSLWFLPVKQDFVAKVVQKVEYKLLFIVCKSVDQEEFALQTNFSSKNLSPLVSSLYSTEAHVSVSRFWF